MPTNLNSFVKLSELVAVLEKLDPYYFFCVQLSDYEAEESGIDKFYIPFKTILREEFPITGTRRDYCVITHLHSDGIKEMYLATNIPHTAKNYSSSKLRERLVDKLKTRIKTSGDRLMVAGNMNSFFKYPKYQFPKNR